VLHNAFTCYNKKILRRCASQHVPTRIDSMIQEIINSRNKDFCRQRDDKYHVKAILQLFIENIFLIQQKYTVFIVFILIIKNLYFIYLLFYIYLSQICFEFLSLSLVNFYIVL